LAPIKDFPEFDALKNNRIFPPMFDAIVNVDENFRASFASAVDFNPGERRQEKQD